MIESALAGPAAAEAVARVGEPVEVKASGERGPERDQEHGPDLGRHDPVRRERREGEACADREPDHREPAGRAPEIAGIPAPRERQDREVAESDEGTAEDAHAPPTTGSDGRVVASTARLLRRGRRRSAGAEKRCCLVPA